MKKLKTPSLDRDALYHLILPPGSLTAAAFENFVIAAVNDELRWWLKAEIVKFFVFLIVCGIFKNRLPFPPKTPPMVMHIGIISDCKWLVLLWYLFPNVFTDYSVDCLAKFHKTFTPNSSSWALVAICALWLPHN